MNYTKLLEDGYARSCEQGESRLEYLSDHIFDFTTYESEAAELFASWMLKVCKAIRDGHTFAFIEEQERRRWFLLMVNMPFLAGRLNWGTSIRDAWFDCGQRPFDSCGLFDGDEQVTELLMPGEEFSNFIGAVLTFAGTA